MGHRRLGRLPKTLGFKKLMALLGTTEGTPSVIAEFTAKETSAKIDELADGPVINFCHWLLTRISWFSRSDHFLESLTSIGIDVPANGKAAHFVSRIADVASKEIAKRCTPSVFSDIAEQALRQTLTETITERSRTLFGTSLQDVQAACRDFSTKSGFGNLSRRFYANLLSRFVNYFVQKELSNNVGAGKAIDSIASASSFTQSLNRYCWESARIVEDFSGGWYSKHNWEKRGDVSEDDVRPFTTFAMRKLRMELAREDSPR
jgi:hypothetical protein